MTQYVARRAYSAEQLLALRDSASDEPALKIETRVEDGSIKDHVLRNAHSFAARSTRSFAASDTLRPPHADPRPYHGPVLGEIDPNNQTLRPGSTRYRPSPTPSLEKRKAEQILKDHGSPPGLRVTAGGRIVPSDQSPLCSPRFGYSAIQKNGGLIRFAPNYPPSGSTVGGLQETAQTLPNGFVAQDPTGRLVQVVDGQFLPVNEMNGIPQLYIAAPNVNNFPPGKMGSNPNGSNATRQQTGQPRASSSGNGTRMRQPTPSIAIAIQALEKQYGNLEQESRDLDKLEVLQRPTMTSKAYQQLVQRRRELVTRLNDIRISLKKLKDQQGTSPQQTPPQVDERASPPQRHVAPFSNFSVMPHSNMPGGGLPGWGFDGLAPEAQGMVPYPGGPMPAPPELGYYLPQPSAFPAQLSSYPSMTGLPGVLPPMFNLMGLPLTDAFHGFTNVVNAVPQTFTNLAPLASNVEPARETGRDLHRSVPDTASSEKESPRRSHALEIRNPEIKSESSQGNKSSLNPMSPSYQPASINSKPSTPNPKMGRTQAESPSPALAEAVRAHNAWVGESRATHSGQSQRVLRYESSNASFATADFFPNNPRDHSVNKQAYPAAGNRSMNSIRRTDEAPLSTADKAPVTPEKEHHNPNWNPTIPDAAFKSVVTVPAEDEVISAPPGAPTDDHVSYKNDPVSNRIQDNMSPKNRRPAILPVTGKQPAESDSTSSCGPSSQAPSRHGQERSASSSSSRLPTSSSSSAYMEGFRAGESHLPIAPEKSTVWVEGYCAGLRSSMNSKAEGTKSAPREPSSQAILAGAQPLVVNDAPRSDRRDATIQRPPFEHTIVSMDSLKEAAFSAQNENVILSPDSNAPTVGEDKSMQPGTWSKQDEAPTSAGSALFQLRNGQANLLERTSSMAQRQLASAEGNGDEAFTIPEARRNFSIQSQPAAATQFSYLRAVYPGNRVLSSQLEWKSGSSIAQVAGLAHGYVAHYDGTLNDLAAFGGAAPLTRMSGNVGANNADPSAAPKRNATVPSPQQTRFVEDSMRTDEYGGGSPSASPSKKSPTKAKFAHIAGKAGIKVRIEEQADEERMSAREKPRWRDVWRKGH